MTPQPMICVPIFKKNLHSAYETADKALKLGADILELRIDAIQDPDVDKIIDLMDTLKGKIIVQIEWHRKEGYLKDQKLNELIY